MAIVSNEIAICRFALRWKVIQIPRYSQCLYFNLYSHDTNINTANTPMLLIQPKQTAYILKINEFGIRTVNIDSQTKITELGTSRDRIKTLRLKAALRYLFVLHSQPALSKKSIYEMGECNIQHKGHMVKRSPPYILCYCS